MRSLPFEMLKQMEILSLIFRHWEVNHSSKKKEEEKNNAVCWAEGQSMRSGSEIHYRLGCLGDALALKARPPIYGCFCLRFYDRSKRE